MLRPLTHSLPSEVLDLVAHGDELFALTREGVTVLDRALRVVASIQGPCPEGATVVPLRDGRVALDTATAAGRA